MLLLSGHGDTDHRVFHDRTALAGLGSEIARGITLADFNKDTDADIFLLREELSADPGPEDKRFYWSNSLVDAASSPSTPKAITIGFAREPGPNNHNTMGIGARVAVAVTKPGGTVLRSVQVVDGGTGRGSQGSARLVFGLAGASTAEITVRWPHGQTQVFDAASVPGFPHLTLSDTSDPEIQSSTVTASYVPSSGYTTHTYTWKSTYPGGTPQVLITAGAKPTDCLTPLGGVTQLLLDPSMGDVNTTSVFADDEWTHTLTWIAYCTDSCTYTYYARNVVGGQVYSSTPKTLNVSVCADITE